MRKTRILRVLKLASLSPPQAKRANAQFFSCSSLFQLSRRFVSSPLFSLQRSFSSFSSSSSRSDHLTPGRRQPTKNTTTLSSSSSSSSSPSPSSSSPSSPSSRPEEETKRRDRRSRDGRTFRKCVWFLLLHAVPLSLFAFCFQRQVAYLQNVMDLDKLEEELLDGQNEEQAEEDIDEQRSKSEKRKKPREGEGGEEAGGGEEEEGTADSTSLTKRALSVCRRTEEVIRTSELCFCILSTSDGVMRSFVTPNMFTHAVRVYPNPPEDRALQLPDKPLVSGLSSLTNAFTAQRGEVTVPLNFIHFSLSENTRQLKALREGMSNQLLTLIYFSRPTDSYVVCQGGASLVDDEAYKQYYWKSEWHSLHNKENPGSWQLVRFCPERVSLHRSGGGDSRHWKSYSVRRTRHEEGDAQGTQRWLLTKGE